jgi:hypothetical protein
MVLASTAWFEIEGAQQALRNKQVLFTRNRFVWNRPYSAARCTTCMFALVIGLLAPVEHHLDFGAEGDRSSADETLDQAPIQCIDSTQT